MNHLFPAFLFLSLSLAASAARAEPDRDIVKVNGTLIRQSEVVDRLWKRFGPATLDEMIDETLLRQEALAGKIAAEPAEVDRRLAAIRSRFPDAATFESQLKQAGKSVEALKRDLADQIAQEKVIIKRNDLSVGEKELEEAFKAHKERLGTPASIHLLHMLVKNDAQAKEAVKKIKAGADFRTIAKAQSLAPTGKINGGDYGFVTRAMLPSDIENIAFALKPKELKTFAGSKGVHLLEVLETRPAVPAEYKKIKEKLRDLLMSEKIKAALPELLQRLRQKADIQPLGGGAIP